MTRRMMLLRAVSAVVVCALLLGAMVLVLAYPVEDAHTIATLSPLAKPTPAMLSPIATPTPAARSEAQALLDRLRQEIIPADGTDAGYGVSFTLAGYNSLLGWNRDVKLTEEQRHDFAGLHVRLPCCGFADTVVDEAQNCACGHHVALYGVAKRLLADGQDRAAVQREINRWARYFFPKEALIAELVRRAEYDPAMSRTLEELKAQGGC